MYMFIPYRFSTDHFYVAGGKVSFHCFYNWTKFQLSIEL